METGEIDTDLKSLYLGSSSIMWDRKSPSRIILKYLFHFEYSLTKW